MAFFQFYYPKRISFSPDDYEPGRLGGGESALVLVARGLAARGHRVEVLNATWRPARYDGVKWFGAWDISSAEQPDVWISVRFEQAVANRGRRRNLFWMLDDRADGAMSMLKFYNDAKVIVASESMRKRLQTAHASERIVMIPLPVETKRYSTWFRPSASNLCLHSSMPNRGLSEFLKIWPYIHDRVPQAELIVTSGWQLWGYTKEEERDRWQQTIPDLLPRGVEIVGVVPRKRLVEIQSHCRLAVFPSHFPEMFCLAAAEAAAAGRPIIASSSEALRERVKDGYTGFIVDGILSEQTVQQEFGERVVDLYRNDDLADSMGHRARKISGQYELDSVIDQWEQVALA